MLDTILEILKAHEQLFWLLGLGSIVMFVGSAVLIPYAIILLPVDFFARIPEKPFTRRHPLAAFLLIIFRNALGGVLLVAGIIMLFVPGQGLLTILIGLALIDFPGKHTLLLRMVSNPRVYEATNGIRRWAGKPEFLAVNPRADGGRSSERSGDNPGGTIRRD